MRHRVAGRKLGRKSDHRRALMRNLSTELFRHERIRTTLAKARELRPYAEKLVTMSKRETLHARRIVARDIQDREVVAKLFDSLAARYSERPGGYTRILKLGPRRGDNAEMAIIELVDSRFESEELGSSAPEPKKTTKKKASKSSAPKDHKSSAPKRSPKPSGASKAKAVKKASRRGD